MSIEEFFALFLVELLSFSTFYGITECYFFRVFNKSMRVIWHNTIVPDFILSTGGTFI
ncbi:predicted protein [Acetobacter orientalis]|uniref:Uncharacterized protein n=1 Tax=Acetobacter orientalis TaxID=146474 RepID=A0A2Z5ZM11_9PROT|nr:predicted protein [Acetobacter orientalis]